MTAAEVQRDGSDVPRATQRDGSDVPAVPAGDAGVGAAHADAERRPLYPRLLRLRNIHPNAWQRALLGEGAIALAVLLVLADLATAWVLLVLPLAVAVVVKAHDLLAGALEKAPPET